MSLSDEDMSVELYTPESSISEYISGEYELLEADGDNRDVDNHGQELAIGEAPLHENAAPSTLQETRFDVSIATRHEYLGDFDDLEGGMSWLEPGTQCELPLLLFPGVVLLPRSRLPLKLQRRQDIALINSALYARPPLSKLFVVMGMNSLLRMSPRQVGCTAEIRQLRQLHDGGMHVLAVGRQRVEMDVVSISDASNVLRGRVLVLQDGVEPPVPRAMRENMTWWGPSVARLFDTKALLRRAQALCCAVLPPLSNFSGSPLDYSYWLAGNLPLQDCARQWLLEAHSDGERLRRAIRLMGLLRDLSCANCDAKVADAHDVVMMASEGVGATFVNAHGFVHEMVTFCRVKGVVCVGNPETEHSWFPGYAWTITNCQACQEHLGWRFTAVRPGLVPRVFWGLRRACLTCAELQLDELKQYL